VLYLGRLCNFIWCARVCMSVHGTGGGGCTFFMYTFQYSRQNETIPNTLQVVALLHEWYDNISRTRSEEICGRIMFLEH
jgi:hypothetical protein